MFLGNSRRARQSTFDWEIPIWLRDQKSYTTAFGGVAGIDFMGRRALCCSEQKKRKSKINNQFISPHIICSLFKSTIRKILVHIVPLVRIISFRFFLFHFLYAFFLYYFHIVLKFVPSHEIHRRPSSFVPRARVDFPVESFHKFNIADLKVYSDNTALRIRCENNADRRKLRFERCKWHTVNTTRPFCVIDFNSCISTPYSLSFPIFFQFYILTGNRTVITSGTNRRRSSKTIKRSPL